MAEILNGDDDALDRVDDVAVCGIEREFPRGCILGCGRVQHHVFPLDAMVHQILPHPLAVAAERDGVGFIPFLERGCVVAVGVGGRLGDGVKECSPVAVAVGGADCVVGAEVEVVEEGVSGVWGKMGCVGFAWGD